VAEKVGFICSFILLVVTDLWQHIYSFSFFPLVSSKNPMNVYICGPREYLIEVFFLFWWFNGWSPLQQEKVEIWKLLCHLGKRISSGNRVLNFYKPLAKASKASKESPNKACDNVFE